MDQINKCNFENGTCSLECKKYPMCAYLSIQKQLSELQKQIEFIYQTMNGIVTNEMKIQKSLDETNEKLQDYVCELLEVYYGQDSDLNKESQSEEESK